LRAELGRGHGRAWRVGISSRRGGRVGAGLRRGGSNFRPDVRVVTGREVSPVTGPARRGLLWASWRGAYQLSGPESDRLQDPGVGGRQGNGNIGGGREG
jgi:hypothetical protein